MPGRIRITLEREPDFSRAAELEWNRHYTAVARDPVSSEVFAMCSRSVRNGVCERNACPPWLFEPTPDLTGPPRARLWRWLLKTGFTWLAGTRVPADAPFDITTVVDDNSPARRLLTAGLPGLPVYSELEPMLTFLLPVRRPRARGLTPVTRARSPTPW